MNDTLDNSNNLNLAADFNNAMKMCVQDYSYDELLSFLDSNKDFEKQLAVLEINEIKNKQDMLKLVSNLTGQDGKIREVVAYKINELANDDNHFDLFLDEEIFDIIFEGIMDINGNICRMVVNGRWFEHKKFKDYMCIKLPESIRKTLAKIEKLEENEKQYKISKRNFQLYWSLEALYSIADVINIEDVKGILLETAAFEDYTIREKTAKIISKVNDESLLLIRKQLKNDENYYVRRYLGSV